MNPKVAKATSLFRKRNREPLTAPSAEGAFWRTSCKASPERGGARHWRAEGFVPQRHKGRGGSVSRRDHTQVYRRRAHAQAEPTPKKHTPQTPAALRERGVWGERGFSQRSRLSPQNLRHPYRFSGREREGGAFRRKAASLAIPPYRFVCNSFCLSSASIW